MLLTVVSSFLTNLRCSRGLVKLKVEPNDNGLRKPRKRHMNFKVLLLLRCSLNCSLFTNVSEFLYDVVNKCHLNGGKTKILKLQCVACSDI